MTNIISNNHQMAPTNMLKINAAFTLNTKDAQMLANNNLKNQRIVATPSASSSATGSILHQQNPNLLQNRKRKSSPPNPQSLGIMGIQSLNATSITPPIQLLATPPTSTSFGDNPFGGTTITAIPSASSLNNSTSIHSSNATITSNNNNNAPLIITKYICLPSLAPQVMPQYRQLNAFNILKNVIFI